MEITNLSRRFYCDDCRRLAIADKSRARRDRSRGSALDPDAAWHGTVGGYSNQCCRCDACRSANRAYINEWRQRPEVAVRRKEQARINSRKPEVRLRKKARQYGIDPETLGAYLDDGICFACAKPGRLCVDHDHSCCADKRGICGECVRGLLCRSCNAILGLAQDDRQRLLDLAAYLDRWEAHCASK